MLLHTLEFSSSYDEERILKISQDRLARLREVKGLVQAYYLKRDGEDRYGSVMIWEDAEALAAHRTTDLVKNAPADFGMTDADSRLYELRYPLRNEVQTNRGWVA